MFPVIMTNSITAAYWNIEIMDGKYIIKFPSIL